MSTPYRGVIAILLRFRPAMRAFIPFFRKSAGLAELVSGFRLDPSAVRAGPLQQKIPPDREERNDVRFPRRSAGHPSWAASIR